MHKKSFLGLTQAPTSPQKSTQCMKMKQRKRNNTCKNVIDRRKHFIRCTRKADEKDFHKLWVNYSGHNEGTYLAEYGTVHMQCPTRKRVLSSEHAHYLEHSHDNSRAHTPA